MQNQTTVNRGCILGRRGNTPEPTLERLRKDVVWWREVIEKTKIEKQEP